MSQSCNTRNCLQENAFGRAGCRVQDAAGNEEEHAKLQPVAESRREERGIRDLQSVTGSLQTGFEQQRRHVPGHRSEYRKSQLPVAVVGRHFRRWPLPLPGPAAGTRLATDNYQLHDRHRVSETCLSKYLLYRFNNDSPIHEFINGLLIGSRENSINSLHCPRVRFERSVSEEV